MGWLVDKHYMDSISSFQFVGFTDSLNVNAFKLVIDVAGLAVTRVQPLMIMNQRVSAESGVTPLIHTT